MQPIQVRLKLNASGVNAAMFARLERNTRLLPDALANSICRGISMKAWEKMPKVSVATMDQELEVQSNPVTKLFHETNGARGGLSRAKKPRYRNIVSHMNSMASRIVLASFYPDSPFNIRTGGVFQRAKPASKGSEAFWNWIGQTASRMVKARHSSGGFYKACAYAVNVGFSIALGKMDGARWVPSDNPSAGGDINKISKLLSKGLAKITPASGGNGRAGFSVATTEPDTKGSPANRGINRVLQPVWQAAVDSEARFQYAKAQKAYKAAMEDAGFVVR